MRGLAVLSMAVMLALAGLAPAQAAQCPQAGAYASVSGGPRISVTFVNNSGDDLDLFWIDFRGNHKMYQSIGDGQRVRMDTYAEHVWFAQAPDGSCWPAWVVPRQNTTHTFNP